MRPWTIAIVLAALCGACSGGKLSSEEALRVIRSNSTITTKDTVAVEAVSQAEGAAEAIVKAKVNAATMNLKLRRYDKGWQWEFAETNGGSWIAPHLALEPMREEERLARAAEWAKPHLEKYALTATVLALQCHPCPRSGDEFDLQSWDARRKMLLGVFERKQNALALRAFREGALDGWEKPIEVGRFDSSKRAVAFRSLGPDGKAAYARRRLGRLLRPFRLGRLRRRDAVQLHEALASPRGYQGRPSGARR